MYRQTLEQQNIHCFIATKFELNVHQYGLSKMEEMVMMEEEEDDEEDRGGAQCHEIGNVSPDGQSKCKIKFLM